MLPKTLFPDMYVFLLSVVAHWEFDVSQAYAQLERVVSD